MLSYSDIRELAVPIPEEFRGLDPSGEIRIYQRNLPHWRQDGAAYFVMFRQADSIPKDVWEELSESARWWRRKIDEEGELSEGTSKKYEEFQKRYHDRLETALDECSGSCLLRKEKNFDLVESALLHFDENRYEVYAYVVMPNHCHVLIRPRIGHELEKILQSWKVFTSRRIEGADAHFWHFESHDRIIRNEDHFRRVVRYILKNPLKANLSPNFSTYYVKGALEDRKTKFQLR